MSRNPLRPTIRCSAGRSLRSPAAPVAHLWQRAEKTARHSGGGVCPRNLLFLALYRNRIPRFPFRFRISLSTFRLPYFAFRCFSLDNVCTPAVLSVVITTLHCNPPHSVPLSPAHFGPPIFQFPCSSFALLPAKRASD